VLDTVGHADLSDEAVAAVQYVIVETGALAALESQIAALTDQAIAAIAVAPITANSRSELVDLARYVSQRET
jgi:geranylgeranyl diphosphate synthase type I